MYIEFAILIFEYFKTLTKRNIIYEWFIPILIGLITLITSIYSDTRINYSAFQNNAMALIGVLLGFSIMVITILVTSNNENIEKIKSIVTEYEISNKKISLYRLLLINYSYLIIIEALTVTIYFMSIAIRPLISIEFKLFGFSLFVLIILHIMLITIRNISDFYLIITK